MSRTAKLISFVAMKCSGPALLAPVCRWALRALREVADRPILRRARVRPVQRRARPIAEVRRAGPAAARRVARQLGRRATVRGPDGA